MRQPARALVELAVAQPQILVHNRHRLRTARNLPGKQIDQRAGRKRTSRRVPVLQNGAPLERRQDLQAADRTVGFGNRSPQQTLQTPRQRLHPRPIKKVGGIFQRARDPRRSTLRRAMLQQAQRQVELGAAQRNRLSRGRNSRKLHTRRRRALHRQHHLEQRVARQRARRVENLHQPLKRKILVAVGRQIAGTHPRQKLPEARIPRGVGAKHQRVHKETDKIVQRRLGATRNRAADRNVAARTMARQQRRKPTLHNHEQAGTALPAKTSQRTVQLRIKPDRNAVPAMARHRRPRTIERKIKLVRQSRQPFPPVRQLPRDRARRIALRAQNLMLPQRVVGILHRKSRKPRSLPKPARRIAARKVAKQRAQRPTVPGNVMQHQQQNMLLVPQHVQMRPQRRLARKIKPAPRRRTQRTRKPARAHRLHHKPRTPRRPLQDLLARNPVPLREDGAKALVPINNVAQRRFQRRCIQPTRNPNRQRDVVGGAALPLAAALQTVQEPQPTLRIRQRDLLRTRPNPQRRTPHPGTRNQTTRNTLHRRGLEQAADRDLHVQAGADPADQTRRQQRMTPEREEVIPDPHTLDPQNLRKQRAQNLLLRAARRTMHAPHTNLRGRKRLAVELAVHRQRKTIQHHQRARNHVVRKTCRYRSTQPRNIDRRPASPHHVAHQPPVPGRILARHHRRLRNPAVAHQNRLDLARLDPVAAQLHLLIGPPHKLQHAVARQRARSPLRYIRLPRAPYGSATNRSAVSPRRPR